MIIDGIETAWLKPFDISWSTPSVDSTGSMPVGGGNLALNVWVTDGIIHAYIGCSDSFDEQGILRK
jgi:hypothetical protein